MRQVVRADVYDEVSILKGLRHRQSDHPEGATKDRAGGVGPNADHAKADLDRAADSAIEDHRASFRVHFRSSAFEWDFRPRPPLTSIPP